MDCLSDNISDRELILHTINELDEACANIHEDGEEEREYEYEEYEENGRRSPRRHGDERSIGFASGKNVTLEQQYKDIPTDAKLRFEDVADCIHYSGVTAIAERLMESVITKADEYPFPDSIGSMSTRSVTPSSSGTNTSSAITFQDSQTEKFLTWPTIQEFNEKLGEEKIKTFCSRWYYEEDWLYTVNLVHSQSDSCSDYYIYETIWSIPTKEYPVPQVTASILFTIIVSRIKPKHCEVSVYYVLEGGSYRFDPRIHQFHESWLFNIVDAKLQLFKTLRF